MKRRLLAFVFVLGFAITSFAALGVSGVSAVPLPGGDNAACDGLGTALSQAVPGAPDPVPVEDIIETVTGAYPGDCGF